MTGPPQSLLQVDPFVIGLMQIMFLVMGLMPSQLLLQSSAEMTSASAFRRRSESESWVTAWPVSFCSSSPVGTRGAPGCAPAHHRDGVSSLGRLFRKDCELDVVDGFPQLQNGKVGNAPTT